MKIYVGIISNLILSLPLLCMDSYIETYLNQIDLTDTNSYIDKNNIKKLEQPLFHENQEYTHMITLHLSAEALQKINEKIGQTTELQIILKSSNNTNSTKPISPPHNYAFIKSKGICFTTKSDISCLKSVHEAKSTPPQIRHNPKRDFVCLITCLSQTLFNTEPLYMAISTCNADIIES